jgi:RNA polymerase sigma factor (sigma-70 family)
MAAVPANAIAETPGLAVRAPHPRTEPRPLEALARAAQSGNDSAFEELHRRLSGGLCRHFLGRTGGDLDLADELTQGTWVRVWQALRQQRYDPARAAISTFVYAVGQNVWLQHRRSTTRRPGLAGESSRIDCLLAGGSDDPADWLAAAEMIEAVRQAVRVDGSPESLTTDERVVIDGLAAGQSERRMADVIGVAASTIHARKTSALEKLRRLLARRGLLPGAGERTRGAGE